MFEAISLHSECYNHLVKSNQCYEMLSIVYHRNSSCRIITIATGDLMRLLKLENQYWSDCYICSCVTL